MERKVILEDISDGKRYQASDMVKADCGGCEGCSACCQGMGNSITLDPYDVHRLVTGLGISFTQLLSEYLELNASEGMILLNIKMKEDRCSWLNQEGRCSIHSLRPGICRLFPLGRVYENGGIAYFLQSDQCPKPGKTKVKVKKWLDTPDFNRYEQFVSQWHYFLKDMKILIANNAGTEFPKQLNMYLLTNFYLTPFDSNADFFTQLESRLIEARKNWCS